MPRTLRHAASSPLVLALGAASAALVSPTPVHADEPRLEVPAAGQTTSASAAAPTATLATHLDPSWTLASVVDTHGFHVERFEQRFAELRVDGADAVVRARRDGVVDVVRIETPVRAGTVVAPGRSVAPDTTSLAETLSQLPLGFVIERVEVEEAVLAADRPHEATRLVPAHRVLVRGARPIDAMSVLVEDVTGRVLRIDPLAHDARGLVYLRNAVSDDGMTTEVDLPMQTDAASLTNASVTVRSCIVSAGGACTPTAHATPDAEGNFLYAPEPSSFEDGFAEVMAYHHASVFTANLLRDHGFTWRCGATGPTASDSMRIFANFTDSPGRAYANAAFMQGSRTDCGYLVFGQSGMQDFASDADVVYHEYGHAVTDQLSHIVGFAVDALGMHYDPLAVNEGTSDYWAATTQGDPHVGESLMGLDGIGRSAALRDLDGALRCPNDLFGEGHFDGRIWSGVFWDLRTEIGAEKIDALLFATISSIGTAPSLRASAEMAVSTADSLATMGTLTTDDAARVRALFMERGLLDCTRVTPLDDGVERGAFTGFALLTGGLGNDVAPVHYSLTLPADATAAHFEISPGTLIGQYAVLSRNGSPVGFRGTGIQLDQRDEIGHAGMISYHRADPAFEPCSTIYFAVETTDLDRGESIFVVRGSVDRSGDPSARCPDPTPDAGPPDAFVPTDAPEGADASMGGMGPGGCGCVVAARPTAPSRVAWLALLALGLARLRLVRRQPRR